MNDLNRELQVAEGLALQAGEVLRQLRRAGLTVEHKTSADDPVTQADHAASHLITAGLAREFPHDGLLSEEETDSGERLGRQRVWIIDPIDGTKEYAAGQADYGVSIGLAVDGEPRLGVVYVPDTDELYSAAPGMGVRKNGQPVTGPEPTPPYRLMVSDTEYRRELHLHDLPGMRPSGSIALKLARIAAREFDVTFSMSPRSEWDIAAGHALLRAAGGTLRRRDGQPIRYNQRRAHIEQGIIGGMPQALEWLEAELSTRQLPSAHLGLTAGDPAWIVLSPADQQALRGHPAVSIRYAGEQLMALLVVNPRTRQVERAEGDAFHLERLTRDVMRALGTVQEQALG